MAITWFDPYLLGAVDFYYRCLPRPVPAADALDATRIISHRGERDDRQVLENTFAAFDPLPGRVFGLECDIRYTGDGEPMVFHDPDLYRLFASRERLCDLTREELQRRHPQIPTLGELVQRYGRRIHLMIEVKAEARPDPERRCRRLAELLSPLRAGRDYHLLSLDIPTLDWLQPEFAPGLAAIARSNVTQMSEYALRRPCVALTGHYALLRRRLVARHRAAGQTVGVGFPDSPHCLRFAIAQGARWIYTNSALRLQAALDADRKASSR